MDHSAPAPAPPPSAARLRALVERLCAPDMAGRAPGTPGGARAREVVVEAFTAAGLAPAGEGGWLQEIPGVGANVLGRLPGAGPLAERCVLVGAHYDHLGTRADGAVYWGADDNAAAVAILPEVARLLAGRPLARQVLFVAFDAEEPPHFMAGSMGSMRYARGPLVPLDRTDTMLCMDLVGHAIGPPGFPEAVRRSLLVLGAERGEGTPALVDAAAARAAARGGVFPRRLDLDMVPALSDYHAFDEAGVPTLFLTCGRWEHYHEPTDTPDRLDYDKVAATAAFLADLVEALACRPGPRVAYVPDAHDDRAAVETVATLARALAPLLGGPGFLARLALDDLERAAARGPLGAVRRGALRLLVARLEALVG